MIPLASPDSTADYTYVASAPAALSIAPAVVSEPTISAESVSAASALPAAASVATFYTSSTCAWASCTEVLASLSALVTSPRPHWAMFLSLIALTLLRSSTRTNLTLIDVNLFSKC